MKTKKLKEDACTISDRNKAILALLKRVMQQKMFMLLVVTEIAVTLESSSSNYLILKEEITTKNR